MDQLFEYETNMGTVRGIFSKPNLKKYPVLLVMHGFSGDSIGPHYLFRTFQKQCIEANIGVLRFDYIGCGNSDGDFTENNVTNSIAQSEEILNYLLTLQEVTDIYALGFSMGGLVASELVKRNPTLVKKLLLWSPAGNLGELLSLFYKDAPKIEVERSEFGALILTKAVVEDALRFDVYLNLDHYANSVCVIHGSADSVVPIQWGRQYFEKFHCKKSFFEISGSEHTYEKIAYREQLYQHSLHYLKEPIDEKNL